MTCSKFIKLLLIVFAVFFSVVAGGLGWLWYASDIGEVEAGLARQTPATFYLDRNGNEVHSVPGYDYRWRIPIRLAELPEHVPLIMLSIEDRDFYRHCGVDFSALCRAAFQLLTNGRIISGGSTITMQLMNLGCGGTRRSFSRKLRQLVLALKWERKYSKHEILEDYFNYLLFGGKIYGIEAAARYYFGHSARNLTIPESLLLLGIPQLPNRFRPDLHPGAAKRRRQIVCGMLAGVYPEAELQSFCRRNSLTLRNFSEPCWKRCGDPQFFQLIAPNGKRIHTTYDPELQNLARTLLALELQNLQSVADGAMAVIENSSGKLRALVGTIDYRSLRAGQINGATAWRSPGSAFKPFLYAEAVNGGLLVGDTVLNDAPLSVPDYQAGNFDGKFRGEVRAADALADSLNTPAIRLLREIGVDRMISTLSSMRLLRSTASGTKAGLSLALGGAESRLLALCAAYSLFARNGVYYEVQCLEESVAAAGTPIFDPGSAAMVWQWLCRDPLPGSGGIRAAWKTGTSNRFRDAWCFAVTPEWTVGVWFGNKRGDSSPLLIGRSLASPVAGNMLRSLYRGSLPRRECVAGSEQLISRPLCRRSGLKPSSRCAETGTGLTVRNIPLRVCDRCGVRKFGAVHFLSPGAGRYRTGSDGVCRLQLTADSEGVHWFWNGKYQGKLLNGTVVAFPPGGHRLRIWHPRTWGGDGVDFEVFPAL